MSNAQTKTVSLAELQAGYTRSGPWDSRYTVSVDTVAVNVAQRARSEVLDDDTPHDVWAAVDMLQAAAGDGSINGFWGKQIERVTGDALAAVVARAAELIRIDEHAPYGSDESLGERFDGQH